MKVMKCIKKAFNAKDDSLELHDVLAAAFCIAFILQAIMATITNALIAYHNLGIASAAHPEIFNAQQYGVGCGAVVAAVGTAGWLKSRNRQADIQPPVTKTEEPV